MKFPKGNRRLTVSLENGGAKVLQIVEEIGRGGSCIAYRAVVVGNGVDAGQTRIVKEFYPASCSAGGITRKGRELSIQPDHEAAFRSLEARFNEGASRFGDFYEWDQGKHSTAEPLIGTDNNTSYAITRLAGEHLLSKEPPLDMNSIAQVMKSVCMALEAFHSHGMLYLDAKPSNTYWYEVDGTLHARLFDFDTVVETESLRSGNFGYISHSDGWSSPEQVNWAAGRAPASVMSAATDAWAVGAMLFWLVTGDAPTWNTASGAADDASLLKDGLFDWRGEKRYSLHFGRSGEVLAKVDEIARKTLHRDPVPRCGSMIELAGDFDMLCSMTESDEWLGERIETLQESVDHIVSRDARIINAVEEYSSRLETTTLDAVDLLNSLKLLANQMSPGKDGGRGVGVDADELELIRRFLPLSKEGTGKDYLLKRKFVGRSWLKERVESWLDDGSGGSLLAVYGGPGTGKSAFCVHLASTCERVVAATCLSYERDRSGSPLAMLQSIAFQLASHLPEYRRELVNVHAQSPVIGSMAASDFLDIAIAEPLGRIHPKRLHGALCVMIDGLDECSSENGNDAVALIRELVLKLPDWLRVIILSRPDAEIVHAMVVDSAVEIEAAERDNNADIESFLRDGLLELVQNHAERKSAASALAALSGGVFIFAEAAIQAIRLGSFDPTDESSYPQTLDSVFNMWFSRAFPIAREYREHWRLPLGAILASPEPIPKVELERLLSLTESDVNDLTRTMGSLLLHGVNEFGNETLSISHRYYADWLTSERAGRFAVSQRDSMKSMALSCYEIIQTDLSSITPYEAEHALQFMRDANLNRELSKSSRNAELASFLFDIGETHWNEDRLNRAETCFEETLGVIGGLDEECNDPITQKLLSVALERLGHIAREKGDLDSAEEYYRKALSIHERIVNERDEPDSLRGLAYELVNLGGVFQERGDFDKAEKLYQKSLSVQEGLSCERQDYKPRLLMTYTLRRCGNVAREKGDLDSAEEYYRKALSIHERIVNERDEPGIAWDLSNTLEGLGDIARDRNDLYKAEKFYREALSIHKGLGESGSLRGLSITLERLGSIARKRGDLDSAEKYYQETFSIRKSLSEEMDTQDFYRGLSFALVNLGAVAEDRGNFDDAEKHYREALEIRERLFEEHSHSQAQRDLDDIHERLIGIARKGGAYKTRPYFGLGHAYCCRDLNSGSIMLTSNIEEVSRDGLGEAEIVWVYYSHGKIDHAATAKEYQEEIEIRVGERLAALLTDSQIEEFDSIENPSDGSKWLEENLPGYKAETEMVISEMREARLLEDLTDQGLESLSICCT